jgi:hypothetical protein
MLPLGKVDFNLPPTCATIHHRSKIPAGGGWVERNIRLPAS